MLGSVRAAVPRIVPRRVPAGVRTVITKSERWTTETARNAQQIIEGPNSQDLTKVLPNIEGMWPKMAKEEQYSVYKALEELQRKNWKELALDEKKAAYFVSYGPYGPRKAAVPQGQTGKVILGVTVSVLLGFGAFYGVRSIASAPPKTLTKEYQEQMTARAKETRQNPISGISSEGYKGKGHVV
ncbi:Cytochrome c oxidase subunit 5B, mitochondrial [Malassezia caprae]|uniref:Cytochrome c oxidase subunit 5B, mitochondrial n=1 Tax=Malassezia caprae TaxID=1381934 RepID=A0AAF0ITI2_9BASI|nr:Cytochrome c oxidase subunit 5B, mitochondrial [Malassezia caprae]